MHETSNPSVCPLAVRLPSHGASHFTGLFNNASACCAIWSLFLARCAYSASVAPRSTIPTALPTKSHLRAHYSCVPVYCICWKSPSNPERVQSTSNHQLHVPSLSAAHLHSNSSRVASRIMSSCGTSPDLQKFSRDQSRIDRQRRCHLGNHHHASAETQYLPCSSLLVIDLFSR